jgi:hypothetical protein
MKRRLKLSTSRRLRLLLLRLSCVPLRPNQWCKLEPQTVSPLSSSAAFRIGYGIPYSTLR